jgi:hypothetical protein
MKTFTDLKKNLLYSKLKLKEALSGIIILGNEIDCPFISAWATMEMTGYPSVHEIADYRLYSKIYNVNFKREGETYHDFPVPYESVFSEKPEERWSYYYNPVKGFDGVYRLEDGGLHIPANELKPQMHAFLAELFGPDVLIIGISEFISSKIFRKIILASEEIMINFLVKLETRFGREPSIDVLRLFQDDIQALFLEVFLETGNANHLDLHIKYKPIDLEGYYDAIFELYDDCEVTDDEQDEAIDLLDTQRGSATGPDNLGTVIEDYVKRMAELYPKFGYKGVKLKKAIIAFYGLDKTTSG